MAAIIVNLLAYHKRAPADPHTTPRVDPRGRWRDRAGRRGACLALLAAARTESRCQSRPRLLSAIREHNPLLFDFVLKRHLRSAGKRFAPGVFETRSFFTS